MAVVDVMQSRARVRVRTKNSASTPPLPPHQGAPPLCLRAALTVFVSVSFASVLCVFFFSFLRERNGGGEHGERIGLRRTVGQR